MLESLHPAILSATLSIAAYVPYARAILLDQARPQRSSWLIWSLLSTTAFFAVLSSGGTQGLLFTSAQAAGTAAIFALSLWRGIGSLANRSDAAVLGLAALGLGLWWWTEAPEWAMALSILIGTMGGLLTVAKAYERPFSEVLLPWSLQWLAAGFGILSVTGGTAIELAYPVYLFTLYTAIFAATLIGRATSGAPFGGAA